MPVKRQLTIAAFVGMLTIGGAAIAEPQIDRVSTPALHVIGVQEGRIPPSAVSMFAKECQNTQKSAPVGMAPPAPNSPFLSDKCGKLSADIGNRKEVIVNVTDGTRPIVLALTAYNKTSWKVSLTKGVTLTKVILGGYHSQQISGIPPKTPIEVYTYDPSPCKQCWQGSKFFYSYEKPPEELKEITGLEVTSFQGRYSGSEFSIFPGMKKFE